MKIMKLPREKYVLPWPGLVRHCHTSDRLCSTGGVVRDIFCALFNLEWEISSNQYNVLIQAEQSQTQPLHMKMLQLALHA